MEGILGKKVGMTQIFSENSEFIPVTVIEAGPCRVTAVMTPEKHGYRAVQICFDEVDERRVTKPKRGLFKKAGIPPRRFVREIRLTAEEKFESGQEIKAGIFKKGDLVDVRGISTGKGFQGIMKRWNARGGGGGHGSMFHRQPGSIGSSSDPSRVFKGQHMAGHMGAVLSTAQNLEVVDVDAGKNLLLVRGAVPGKPNNYLVITKAKKG